MFRTMRRFKQELTREECLAVLRSQPRGVLSLLGENGYPYGLPIDYWYNETDGKLYFHGAKEGHKIDAIRACDKASFCVHDEGQRLVILNFGIIKVIPKKTRIPKSNREPLQHKDFCRKTSG